MSNTVVKNVYEINGVSIRGNTKIEYIGHAYETDYSFYEIRRYSTGEVLFFCNSRNTDKLSRNAANAFAKLGLYSEDELSTKTTKR
jgi:hypothetical protein